MEEDRRRAGLVSLLRHITLGRSKICFTWELGGGMGHLLRIAPLAKALRKLGHRVFLISKDLPSTEGIFTGSGVEYLPAPSRGPELGNSMEPPCSYAHVLHNIGFGQDRCLWALVSAWRNLYRLIRPDLIIFDHSPTALLAARGAPAKRVVIGSGFCIPPDTYPFPNLRPQTCSEEQLKKDEDTLLRRVNTLLQTWRQPLLQRLGQLFSQVDEQFITTFKQLDHYPERPTVRYWGTIGSESSGGKEPVWPEGEGPRIYAYLKPFAGLNTLLQNLEETGVPVLIYIDAVAPVLQTAFKSTSVRFACDRLDILAAAKGCDVAITHGTLGTTSVMLAAGKPLLMLPLVLEQGMLARRVEQLGAGLHVPVKQPQEIGHRLRRLIKFPNHFQSKASQLAKEFAIIGKQQQEMVNCLSAWAK